MNDKRPPQPPPTPKPEPRPDHGTNVPNRGYPGDSIPSPLKPPPPPPKK